MLNNTTRFFALLLATLLLPLCSLSPAAEPDGKEADEDHPPATYVERAEEAFLQGKTRQAITAWSKAAELFADQGDAVGRAGALAGLGAAYLKLSEYSRAAETFSTAQQLYAQAEDLAGRAACITNLADVLFQQGDFDKSLKLRKTALELRDQLNDDQGKAIDLVGLAQIYSKKGLRRQAVDTYTEALKIFSALDQREGMAAAVSGIGIEYMKLGAYDTALLCHEDSLKTHQAMADDFQQARDLINIGNVYEAVCDYTAAIDSYAKAFHIQKRLDDKDGAARSLLNLGICSKNLGQYAKALQQLREALAIFQTIKNRSGTADCYTNLGILFKNIGGLKRAETYYRRAMQIHEQLGDTPNWGADLANLGVLYALRKQHDEALRFFEQAEKVFKKTYDRKQAAIASANAASCLAQKQELEEATKKLDGAAAEFEKLKYNTGLAHCKLAAGTIERRRGNYQKARTCYQQALDLSRSSEEPDLACLCRGELARSMAEQGKVAEAIEMYTAAITQIEKLRRNVGTFQLATVFLDKRSQVYYRAVSLLADRAEGSPERAALAYQYMEMGRARSFVDMLAEAGIDVREGAEPDLLTQEKFLLARMAAINKTICSEAAEGASEERLQALKTKLQDTQTSYHKLQITLKQRCPRYGQLYYPDPLVAKQVQGMLEPEALLLEYAVSEEKSFLFALTATDLKVYELPPEKEIREQIEAFREILLSRRSRTYCTAAHGLYQMLVAPAEKLLEGKRHIIIVPDDFLHYLAFECLLTEKTARVDFARLPYLLRRAVVSYAPSATALSRLSQSRQAAAAHQKEILICADPDYGAREDEVRLAMRDTLGPESGLVRLPYSSLEAKNVSSVFPAGGVVLLDRAAASEERLKSMDLSGFQYIDFATHAVLDEQRPEFSSIVLAQTSGEEDGFLQMQEIFNLKLNAKLVVLSACSTARGRLLEGEGMVGLSRAFFYAGAPSVVASLWNVNDASTSLLMAELFKGLRAQNLSPAEALRQAKLKLIQTSDAAPFALVPDKLSASNLRPDASYSHPFYWAAFVLIGQ